MRERGAAGMGIGQRGPESTDRGQQSPGDRRQRGKRGDVPKNKENPLEAGVLSIPLAGTPTCIQFWKANWQHASRALKGPRPST